MSKNMACDEKARQRERICDDAVKQWGEKGVQENDCEISCSNVCL